MKVLIENIILMFSLKLFGTLKTSLKATSLILFLQKHIHTQKHHHHQPNIIYVKKNMKNNIKGTCIYVLLHSKMKSIFVTVENRIED